MPAARATVAEGRVHSEFLPADLRHTSPKVILNDLEEELPERQAQERAEQVVCHGDLLVPNIVIDPETSRSPASSMSAVSAEPTLMPTSPYFWPAPGRPGP